uniref:Putative conserved plasma membrane protein n=1 Tax=Triatoma infestans TaxID=30076 RepID=A0A023F0B0_TRIIF
MKVTKAGVIAIILIVVLSMFVANISNLISVSDSFKERDGSKVRKSLIIGNSTEHLMWFMQISDLHLSIFQDSERITEFQEFCDQTLKIIQPLVVLATGDLTDAKQKDMIGSKQFEEEWIKYRNVLNKCDTLHRVKWLDIRGNHDNFDVPGVDSYRNFFRSYSVQGKSHLRSYIEILKQGSERYAFIGLDACPEQGLKRPFNFVGIVQDNQMKELNDMSKTAENEANYTIWFGHYPTSCILSHKPGIRPIIGSSQKSLAYLCGHFHSMLGFVPNMYTIQQDGFLELELADWKDNRIFRLAAIDHGLLSFIDIKHREWPIILVTNPKHALYQLHTKEPVEAIGRSTHIRILVFSPNTILAVRIKLDDGAWKNCLQSDREHVYLHEWNPQQYGPGLHQIQVSVLDEVGREKSITQPFSVDGSTMKFGIVPRLLLMLNFSVSLQVLFGFATVLSVLPLCFLRFMNLKLLASKKPFSVLKNGKINSWVRRLWILANIDRFFIPIVLYPLYMAAGPWAVGELIDGYIGVIFIWGIFVNGSYVPGSFTYGYGFVQLFLFQGPLVVFTAYALDRRLQISSNAGYSSKTVVTLKAFFRNLPFVILFISQLGMAYTFWLAYGTMALICGPIRLWPLFLTLWAWYHASTLSLRKIRIAALPWINVNSIGS